VRIAILGSYNFNLQSFKRVTGQIISTERHFWRADGSPPYLVTMAPLASLPAQSSYGGTGRTDGFALWVDRAAPLQAVKWLLAHEYFHTWNPAHLGGRPPTREARQELMWFTEGFTDYYARALMVRSGLITPQEFVDQWNSVLLAYGTSPARAEPNRSAARQSADGEPFERLPYQRGALLAAIWNSRLAAASKGRTNLDDVLKEQLRRAREDGPDPAAAFVQVGRRYGLNAAEDIERHVDRGNPILLPPDVFGPCATVSNVRRPAFSRGFDAEATAQADNVVRGVDPSSTAYAAGLRDGMLIVGRKAGETGNSLVEYALLVEDAQVRRTIRYMPQDHTVIDVQQIKLNLPVRAECSRLLGGSRNG
jgi:predicted metalloprotease with PDZ domain